jgi:Peptidase A4 family/Subtilase family/Putative Ig domain
MKRVAVESSFRTPAAGRVRRPERRGRSAVAIGAAVALVAAGIVLAGAGYGWASSVSASAPLPASSSASGPGLIGQPADLAPVARDKKAGAPIAGSYVVVLKNRADLRDAKQIRAVARQIVASAGGRLSTVYTAALHSFAAKMSAASPTRDLDAIVVGATDPSDNRVGFSSYGECVDLFAPGYNVTTATNTSDTAVTTQNGTSFSAPTVAGAAALYLSTHPADLRYSATGLPDGTSIDQATGVISGTTGTAGSSTVEITVTDGTESTCVSFVWDVVLGHGYVTTGPWCLDNNSSVLTDGNPIQLYDCGHKWIAWSDGRIEWAGGIGHCVSVSDQTSAAGVPIVLSTCTGAHQFQRNRPVDQPGLRPDHRYRHGGCNVSRHRDSNRYQRSLRDRHVPVAGHGRSDRQVNHHRLGVPMRQNLRQLGLVAATCLGLVATPLSAPGAAIASRARSLNADMHFGGYLAYNTSFTSVSANWTQPAVSCTSPGDLYSPWVGLDSATTVEQVGVSTNCSTGSPANQAWFEMYPAGAVYLSLSTYPVSSGDSFHAAVTYNGGQSYTLTLSDTTRRWTYSTVQTATTVSNPAAAALIESHGKFPNFGSITFSAVTANGRPFGSLDTAAYEPSSNGVKQASTGALTGGNAFTITYLHE